MSSGKNLTIALYSDDSSVRSSIVTALGRRVSAELPEHKIVEFAREKKVDGVLVGVADILVAPYQAICEKLNMPCYATKDIVKAFCSKDGFKEACKKYGVQDIPGVYINDDGSTMDNSDIEDIDDYEEEIEETPKRVVSIEDLEHMIEDAIRNEEYEIAAEIRDRIEKLKKENK